MRETTVKCSLKREDAEVWYDFKNAVVQKHGKLRESLGDEVANALKLYLNYQASNIEPQQHTRTDKKKRLKDIMERMVIENFVELTEKDIRELIRSIGGMRDKRTEDDYFRCLVDYGFVRHKVRSVYRIDKSKMPRVTT